ncbi:MAG: DUF2892 domain-containing protein [bacterium]|nr:DUF2892 domain-containing protein [bacterium]
MSKYFLGTNLFHSGFTGFCPLEMILTKFILRLSQVF